jgi:hypothetical protein
MTDAPKKRPWDIWKEKNAGDSARPWDLVNPKIGRVDDEIYKARYEDGCLKCEHLINITKTCRKCGCFMTEKAKLPHASCPVGKWDAVTVGTDKGEPNG